MRRSSLLMLGAAIILGLFAVFLARFFLNQDSQKQATAAVQTVPAVIAAAPIAFGEKVAPEKLKVVNWPAEGLPAGSFQRVADITSDDKVALRAIEPNELITDKAVSGKATRLSASTLLGPTMRAVAVPIGETTGVGGFIFPGDRVDVFLTRDPGNLGYPYTDQLIQNARVLAVGQDNNVGKEKAEVTRTATIEVTALQAQKIALARTVGDLSLSLRNILDESRTPLQTAQILDLNDGIPTRIVPRPKPGGERTEQVSAASAMGEALGNALRKPGDGKPTIPQGPTMDIYRGTTPTTYPVPLG